MTAIDETQVEAAWLFAALSDDATLSAVPGGIHEGTAPLDTPHPFLQIDYRGGSDVRGTGPTRIAVSSVWMVKAVDAAATFDGIKALSRRITEVLHAKSGTAQGGQVFACVREQPFRLAEVDGGVQYRHLGGEFRLMSQTEEE